MPLPCHLVVQPSSLLLAGTREIKRSIARKGWARSAVSLKLLHLVLLG